MLFIFALACATTTPTPAEPEPAPAPAPAPAPEPPPLPKDADGNTLCPDGRTVYPFWPGEYPEPIVQINEPFSVQVTNGPCGGAARSCTMPAGLYHPWSTEQPDGAQYGSRTAPSVFTAGAAFSWEDREIKQGDQVKVRTYLAEGMCAMEVGGTAVQGMCPGNQGNPWTEAPRTAPPDDQVLQVPCTDGAPGWLVVDEAFQARPEVSSGEIVGFGEVKRR